MGWRRPWGVDLVELFAYQSFDELFVHFITSGALDPSSSGHCTTASWSSSRSGLPNLVGHNNDIPTYHEGLVTVLRIKDPALDVEILQSTFAGQLAQNGVNSAGVGVGINTLADLPGGSGYRYRSTCDGSCRPTRLEKPLTT